jgi:hypothetical protein
MIVVALAIACAIWLAMQPKTPALQPIKIKQERPPQRRR